MTQRQEIHDQLELYAAGALEVHEMIAFDDHLVRCALCRSRAPALFETAAALIPDSPSPWTIWHRIVAGIEDSRLQGDPTTP